MAKFEMNTYLQRWLDRNAYRALPSMPNWITQDDLVQEGKYCWVVVNERYHEVVTEVAHMVALFKSTYQRRVVDIIKDKRNPSKESSLDQLVEDGAEFAELASAADVDHLILQAPEPVQTILRLLVTDDQRILSAPCRVYLDGTRDTLNRRLHRALRRYDVDIKPTADIPALIRRYLTSAREQLYEEPSIVDIVGALVEERLCRSHPKKPQLHLAPDALVKAQDNLNKRQAKVKVRVRIFPVVEVKKYEKGRDNPQGRVRRGASDPQSRQQMSACARASVRPRVHGDWADCRYQRPQQRGDGGRLRGTQNPDERAGCRSVGSCDAGVGPRRNLGRAAADLGNAGRQTPQHSTVAVRTNGRKPSCTSLHQTCQSPVAARAYTHTRAAVRDTELLG